MNLVSLAAAFAGGVYLGDRLDVPLTALGLLAVAAITLSALLATGKRSLWLALLLAALVLGAARAGLSGDAASALAKYHGLGALSLRGTVVSDPEDLGTATRFRLRVDRIGDAGDRSTASGDALVTMRASADLARQRDRPYVRYGDRFELTGALQAPPQLEGFDYPAFLARQGIGTVVSFPQATLVGQGEGLAFYRWLYGVRRRLAESLAKAVPEPQASLGQALLLGVRDNLPESLVEDFRTTGTSHLLAISGLHVGVLLGLTLTASGWAFGRRGQRYLIAPLATVWLYALIAGMSPSVVRAAIMGGVYLLALPWAVPEACCPRWGWPRPLWWRSTRTCCGAYLSSLASRPWRGSLSWPSPLPSSSKPDSATTPRRDGREDR